MIVASPIWLIGLAPWAAAVLYLLWGRRRRQTVPFLPLWRGIESRRIARSLMAPPPLALVLALVALLASIVAAARPMLLKGRGVGDEPVTIVIDRGLTMSATSHGEPRFVELARRVAPQLRRDAGDGPVRLVDAIGDEVRLTTRSRWADEVAALAPTARVDHERVEAWTRQRMRRGDGVIIVLTDRPVGLEDAKVVEVMPDAPLNDVGIVALAAREAPTGAEGLPASPSTRPAPGGDLRASASPSTQPAPGQVMVSIRNDASARAITLRIITGQRTVEREVNLPPRGSVREFVDMRGLGEQVEAELIDAADDLAADDQAFAAREAAWPAITAGVVIPPELRRMVDVYQRRRPPRDDSRRIAIVGSWEALPTGQSAVALSGGGRVMGDGDVDQSHENILLRYPVDFHPIAKVAAVSDHPPTGDGWETALRIGARPAIMIRRRPVRQAWIGLDVQSWAAMPAYVMFWTDVFNWLGGDDAGEYVSYPLSQWTPEWTPEWTLITGTVPVHAAGTWPGFYQRGDAKRAFNLDPFTLPKPPAAQSWAAALHSAIRRVSPRVSIAPWLLLFAAACLTLSAALWPTMGRGPNGDSPR
jgi:hypothetical protein